MTAHTGLICYCFLDQKNVLQVFHIFFAYMKTPSKNSDCKTQITVKKLQSQNAFSFNRHCIQSPIKTIQFFGNLRRVAETSTSSPLPSPYPTPLSYFRGWNGNFEWPFYKNIKDAFNEDLLLCPFCFPSSISNETTDFINIY